MSRTSHKQGEMRLAKGGHINRKKSVEFTFDGKRLSGFEGDTLASALLANGIHLVGRSFKYHRPRGILTAGYDEPNALMQIGDGAYQAPNIRATEVSIHDGLKAVSQNRWPSLGFDVGAINSVIGRLFPAGFYYKTFMFPAMFWKNIYEPVIRRAAGLGKAASDHNDPDRYEKTHRHVDVLIVGGGVAGLSAALSAGRSGARVMIVDEGAEFGGWMLSEADTKLDGKAASTWIANTVKELSGLSNVTMLSRTQCFGYMDQNFLTLAEKIGDHLAERPAHLPRQRLWKIRAKQVVLAQGVHERPLVFGGNDKPGVMMAGAVRSYINRYAVIPGHRAVVYTNNDDAYKTALALHHAGVKVAAVVDQRPAPSSVLVSQVMKAGITVYNGHAVLDAKGTRHVGSIKIGAINPATGQVTDQPFYLDADLVAMSGGFTPIVNLHSQARGKITWDEQQVCFRPSEYHEDAVCVGGCNGIFGVADAMQDGAKGGADAASAAGYKTNPATLPEVTEPDYVMRPHVLWKMPSDAVPGQEPKAFVDFQNDVTASDIKLAVREGYHSVEHVKRYTTNGMATDQGKMSNINALGILSDQLGKPIPDVGTTTFRYPYTPTTFGTIAGREIKGLFDTERLTRMDSWHRKHGAKYEHVGQWMRAWYYPNGNETMDEAVMREVKAARSHAGILDASTLGKIDIRGKDAAEFLNRVYTNAWTSLKVGSCRYGLMLKDDGMVMDDGVTTRLGENHFHMTTTTGGAAGVLGWLEEWLQTEWPELEVYLTSVTEEWSVTTVSGPNARKILEAAGCSVSLNDADFPFMTYQDATLAGLPVRIFRISFTGELSFEINIKARHGLALWKHLMEAGEPFGLTPYGTEAMHVLRAEKGFIIVGQETDGSVNPHDLGMSWIVSKKKSDFIGKRALERKSMALTDRKQLVGLKTEDPKVVIPEGAHAVLDPKQSYPMEMLGQVTSSYFSPNLGHSIAMGLLKGGHGMKGQTVWFPMIDGRKPIKAVITDPVFYDPKGDRING
jgi:sarcosine oxidase subunit alpha